MCVISVVCCILNWLYTAGAVVCVENTVSVSNQSESLPTVLEAVELVAVRLLEPVPVGDPEPVSVQGRLHEHSSFWLEELEASSFVKDIVTCGYRIPFVKLPWPVFKANHRSALEHQAFVSTAIRELVETNCVTLCEECPTVCSPLSVVENSKGKLRLVIDLRYVNQFLLKQKFKYEGLSLLPQMFKKGDHCITFDLKSGYHHVDIHADCCPYLGFSWLENDIRRFYMFKVLPFGLASACYVFTKLLRPLVKRWRSKGIRAIVYIDDGIVASSSRERNILDRDAVISDLKCAGFVPPSHS